MATAGFTVERSVYISLVFLLASYILFAGSPSCHSTRHDFRVKHLGQEESPQQTAWSALLEASSETCSSTNNNLLQRSDAVNKANGGPGDWSLHSGMVHSDLPVCASPEALMQALRNGQRPGTRGSSWPKYRAAAFEPLGCQPAWFSAEQACGVAGRYSHIILHGDSLSRHWIQGLKMLLSGDLVMGGLPLVRRPGVRENCRCDGQFSEHKACRLSRADAVTDHTWTHGMCYGTSPFAIQFCRGSKSAAAAFNAMCTNDTRPKLVVMQGGAHYRSNATTTIASFIDPGVALLQKALANCSHSLDVHVVWSGLNTQMPGDMDNRYPHQARARAIEFNAATEAHVTKQYDFAVLDFVNLTTNAAVSDGYHYLSEVNILKAMYLLNLADLGGLSSFTSSVE